MCYNVINGHFKTVISKTIGKIMNIQETPTYTSIETIKPVKVKKLKLSPFDALNVHATAVTIHAVEYHDGDLDVTVQTYCASIILFINSAKLEGHPIVINLELDDDCPYCLAYEAICIARVMGGDVLDLVLIHDIDGEIEDECNASEIVKSFEAELEEMSSFSE